MNKKNNSIDNPHDKQFFAALRNHNIARDAMRSHIPTELLSGLDLNKIKLYKTKLVSPQMKELQAYIIYEIPFKNQHSLVFFHCEHESKPNRLMPLKVWQYLFLVLMEYAENNSKKLLPIPMPLIVYTGEQKFKFSTYLFDLFGDNKSLAESMFYQGIKLLDVCHMSDDDIKKHQLFGLCEYAFKHKSNKDFDSFVQTLIPWLQKVEYQIGPYYAKILIRHVIHTFKHGDQIKFAQQVKVYLSKELGDKAMTIAQQLREEGMQHGIQQGAMRGIEQKNFEIAKNMLSENMPLELISRLTNLDINKLKLIEESAEA